jgi:hypothetical protein
MANPKKFVAFHEFCKKNLRLNLTVGQSVVAKIGFGDLNPCDLVGEEREYARKMLGDEVEVIPDSARRFVVLSLGRGSGKTTLCAAYCIYCALLGNTDSCGPGDVPVAAIVAPDKPTARLSIRMATEMMTSSPDLKPFLVTADKDAIYVKRPDGRAAVIEAFAASRGGSSLRGRSILCFLLDEAEFFYSASDEGTYAVTDRAVFGALVPRLIGKGMLISTPWPVETLMGEMFEANWGKPKTCVAMVAPTDLMRPNDPRIAEIIAVEMERDEDNARREFYCERKVNGTSEFFDPKDFIIGEGAYPLAFEPRWRYVAAADFGFVSDASALSIVAYDGRRYQTVLLHELRPVKGAPLKPREVVAKFAELVAPYGIRGIYADQFYQEALREILRDHKLNLWTVKDGGDAKLEAYGRTKALLQESRVVVPPVRALRDQAALVKVVETSGGRKTVRMPRRAGKGHGDLLSSWVAAVNELAYASLKDAPEEQRPDPASPAYQDYQKRAMAAYEAAREKKYIAEQERHATRQSAAARRQEHHRARR